MAVETEDPLTGGGLATAGVNALPVSYGADDKQYVAVAAGGNSLEARL